MTRVVHDRPAATVSRCHRAAAWSVALACCGSALAQSPPGGLLHPVFSQHAVLQREAPLPLYGHAEPGAAVSVTLAGHVAQAQADAEGRWYLHLPALPAGGPHRLEVRSGDAVETVEDVLVGDVWLCSGQSNMVLQVHRALDARAEIAGAGNDRIRMLTVGETGSLVPLETFATPVQWKPARPEHVADFSATCYFFARELQATVDVPMGLVVAAWGGSRIEAWISADALQREGGFGPQLAALHTFADSPAEGAAAWGEYWAEWWRSPSGAARGDAPWARDYRPGRDWREVPAGLGAWERWGDPALARFDGMGWYRASVRLTAAQARQAAVLELGAADEIDLTWVNGVAVGSEYAPGSPRSYPLPPGLLRAGDNSVALNVLDTWRDGGLSGPRGANAIRLADGTRIVAGGWRFRAEFDAPSPPRAPWHTAAGLSTLYNGMIAPIGRYGFRGVLWYQGESNTGETQRYATLLPLLLDDWRRRFGTGLPFLNVQLAGFGAAPTQPTESGWAQLREVQRLLAGRDPRYGIATAVDIGDRYDIHPPTKQELGRRLARLARHLVYGETSLPPTGPVPAAVRREGDAVVVRFEGVDDGLVAYAADGPIGFELCEGEGAASCRYAHASIDGNEVRLRGEGVDRALRVRHAWADSPVITLFDRAGLPAQPFSLPVPANPEH